MTNIPFCTLRGDQIIGSSDNQMQEGGRAKLNHFRKKQKNCQPTGAGTECVCACDGARFISPKERALAPYQRRQSCACTNFGESRRRKNVVQPKSGKDSQPFQERCQPFQESVNWTRKTSVNHFRKKQKNCQPKSGKDREGRFFASVALHVTSVF